MNDKISTIDNKVKKHTFTDIREEKDKNNSIVSKLGGIFSLVPNLFYKDENKNSTSDINELISDVQVRPNNYQENEIFTITPTPTPLEHSEKHNEYENNYNFNICDDSNE
jgi:hypothetical protein